jgi:hypothetical protein
MDQRRKSPCLAGICSVVTYARMNTRDTKNIRSSSWLAPKRTIRSQVKRISRVRDVTHFKVKGKREKIRFVSAHAQRNALSKTIYTCATATYRQGVAKTGAK